MKIDIKIVLLIVFSFLFGIGVFRGIFPTLVFEAKMLLDIFNPGNSFLNQTNILLLIISHLLLISLLFLKPFRLYRTFLIIFPAVFLLFYCTNMLLFLLVAPGLFLYLIPFLIVWIIALSSRERQPSWM
ncbi:hypothetical protein HDF22_001088 [Mucilaginibacter lappiensis]|uniref:Uncharacterized protein n=1 Tax=Mucilaginibacter lappiensis TaxID=354630 RepID=A0A841J9G1_9SPHI|nr:hypothetical protein [Mucilaginibacter lappiensis]